MRCISLGGRSTGRTSVASTSTYLNSEDTAGRGIFRPPVFLGGGRLCNQVRLEPGCDTRQIARPPGLPQDPAHAREVLNLERLRIYLQYCSDKRSKQIDSILSAETPVGCDGQMGPLVAMCSNTSAYGEKYAMSASGKKLSRLGRIVAYRTHGVDIDIENCRPSPLLRLLIRAY